MPAERRSCTIEGDPKTENAVSRAGRRCAVIPRGPEQNRQLGCPTPVMRHDSMRNWQPERCPKTANGCTPCHSADTRRSCTLEDDPQNGECSVPSLTTLRRDLTRSCAELADGALPPREFHPPPATEAKLNAINPVQRMQHICNNDCGKQCPYQRQDSNPTRDCSVVIHHTQTVC